MQSLISRSVHRAPRCTPETDIEIGAERIAVSAVMYAEAPTETRAALVGHNIRAQRHRAGLSQTRLGQRIAVTQQQVSRWEHGVWEPNEDSVRRIAGALGIDWTELYDFTRKP